MSALFGEVYLVSVLLNCIYFLTVFGLLADLDLQDLGALLTDPTELNFLIRLRTVYYDIELLPLTVHMPA